MAWPHVDDLTSPHPLLAAKLGSRTLQAWVGEPCAAPIFWWSKWPPPSVSQFLRLRQVAALLCSIDIA
jgi:hypothetical protein